MDNQVCQSGSIPVYMHRARVKKEAVEKYGISPARVDEIMNSQFDEKLGQKRQVH